MGTFFYGLSMIFPRLLDHSVEISILICLIFLVKLLAPKRLPPWWHYSLWLMLLVRMLVPLEFENRLNVFNYVPAPATQQVSEIILDSPPAVPHILPAAEPEAPAMRPDIQFVVTKAIPVVWLSGAMILGICVLFESFSFWLNIRRKPKVTDEAVLALFSECKSRMKIKRNINIVVTDNVRCPALFGYIRPRLLLPEGIFEKLGDRELSYAFMHELGHLKRHDIGVSWLIAVLQVIHWFNPLVWLAFYQIRIDQESACDAAVLSRMKPRHSADYAKAIVGFLEKFCQNCQLPSLAGVLENRSQMRKRITKIVHYRKSSQKLSLVTVLLLIFSGFLLFSLTGVAAVKEDPASSTPAGETTSFESGRFFSESRYVGGDMTYQLMPEWELPSAVQPENTVVNNPQGPIMASEMPADPPTVTIDETESPVSAKNKGTKMAHAAPADRRDIKASRVPEPDRVEASDSVALEMPVPVPTASNVAVAAEKSSTDASENQQVSTDDISARMTLEPEQTPVNGEALQDFQVATNEEIPEQKTQAGPVEGDSPAYAVGDSHLGFQSDIRPEPDRREIEGDRLTRDAVSAEKRMAEKPAGNPLQGISVTASLSAGREKNDRLAGLQVAEAYIPPRLIKAYPPRYPYLAKRDDITGSITLQFVVNKEGQAVNTTVVESYPEGVFDEAALQAIEQYRFMPGTRDGKAVDVRVNLPIKFDLT